ncbi:MAG: fibrobacter succinogenes major paralogous domain-containing protein, partial [Bacteroidetes bacterium]|nr:fibrobacter succinogenes major paralogous domain-containing protein [Bacteroidota bacterium]
NQLWMKENLKSTHYADGTALIDGTGAGDISSDTTTKYYFAYYDNESYVAVYGRLYTWAAVMNGASGSETNPGRVQGVCPDGWHVPDDDEWKELEMYLGMSEKEASLTYWRGTDEGAKLKESGNIGVNVNGLWRYSGSMYRGNNKSGFTALPAGSRLYNESFRDLSYRANFWTATESFSPYAWCRRLYYNYAEVYRYDDYKTRGYSVRCVKD